MKDKIEKYFNKYILESNKYLFFFFALSIYMFFRYKDLPFFNDELIVNSKGNYSVLDIFKYSSFASYHPPLGFFFHKFINSFELYQEKYFRFCSLAIYTSCYSFAWTYFKDTRFRFALILTSLTNYFYYFSLVVTNYFLGFSTLLVFLAVFLKQRSENKEFAHNHVIMIACISFFSSYSAGITCLIILFIDGLIHHRNRTLQLLFFQIVCLVSTILINIFPSYLNEDVMLISYSIIGLNLLLYRPKQLIKDSWILQIPFIWLTYRILNYMNVYEVHSLAYKPNPFTSLNLNEFAPLIYSLFLSALFYFLYRFKFKIKYPENIPNIFITSLIMLIPFVSLALGEKQIYARYFLYSIPLFYICISYLEFEFKNIYLKTFLLFSVFIISQITKRYDVSYLGIQKTRDMYEKITSHGKYGSFILFFSDSYDWHEFYLQDYKIEKNFKFFTFLKSCNQSTFDRALKMAGENAFFVNYHDDCPQLKEYVLNNCDKYDSKCFNLNAIDGDVILKAFEPWSQEAKIQELEAKYTNK